jgi:HAE1 family hydrophobic/amphiphilic exporter-1
VVLSAALSILIVTISLVPSMGIIFAPPTPQSNVGINLSLREGTQLPETDQVANEIAGNIMERFPDLQNVVVRAGGGGGPFGGRAANEASIDVTLPSVKNRTVTRDEVRQFAREEIAERAGVSLGFTGSNQGLGGGEPVDIVVQSDDLDALSRVASDVRDLLERSFPEVTEPSLDIGEPSPELLVTVDHSRAADLGVQPSAVVNEVKNAFAGTTATRYSRGGEEWDVVVRLPASQRSGIPDIESLFVVSSGGNTIPIANVADVSLSETPTEIQREEQIRTIHVTGGIAPGEIVSEIQPEIVGAIDEQIRVPEQVSVEFSGEVSSIQETTGQIGLVFALAVFLVFAIMASQFESFRMPFIIFFTIPLMVIGVILIHVIMGQPVSMFSLIGLVVLAGIVVNNAIVLVDYTNLLRARGLGLFEATVSSARTRLRPILMTTFTTILGMSPLAFFPGDGADLTQPVGITVVGGLASSTVMTLFVVPVLYSMLASKKGVRKNDAAAELE